MAKRASRLRRPNPSACSSSTACSPSSTGLTLVERLRARGDRTPVLILSALGAVDDRVKGLRAGGDDYLPKPYSLVELVARVEALNPARAFRGRGHDLRRRRSRPGPALPQGNARRRDHPVAAARVTASRISHEARGPSGDPDNASRKHLGLPLRSADQRDRRSYLRASQQNRQGTGQTAPGNGTRGGVHDPQ